MQALSKLERLLNDEIYPGCFATDWRTGSRPSPDHPSKRGARVGLPHPFDLMATLMNPEPLQLHLLQPAQGATKGKL